MLTIHAIIEIYRRLIAASDLVPGPHIYINSNINSDVNVTFQMRFIIIVIAYPDIVIKRYSNNGRIVNANNGYLSTFEWRRTNQFFRIEQIQKLIFLSDAKLLFERIGFCEYPNNLNNMITSYTPWNNSIVLHAGKISNKCSNLQKHHSTLTQLDIEGNC